MKGNKYLRILLCEREDLEEADLIEGPKDIIENIQIYRQPFYDYMEKNYYGEWEDYDFVEGFVEYLNTVVLLDNFMKVKIIAGNVVNETNCYKRIIL